MAASRWAGDGSSGPRVLAGMRSLRANGVVSLGCAADEASKPPMLTLLPHRGLAAPPTEEERPLPNARAWRRAATLGGIGLAGLHAFEA